jgi:photosystem II stability/assembly factor-like uncharacterized protein
MRARATLVLASAVLAAPVTPAFGHAAGGVVASRCQSLDAPSDGYGGVALLSVEFSSRTTGWAAGGDRVVRTPDAGSHWSVSYQRAGAGLFAVDAYNDRDAWALGAHGIARTSDGGRNWHWAPFAALPSKCPAISEIDFYSPQRGVAISGHTLLVTGDGGRAWGLLTSPGDMQSVCFSDVDHGWAGSRGRVYRTVDGGAKWSLAVAGPRMDKAERRITAAVVQCAGPSAGWAELNIGGAAMNQSPHVGYHLSAAGSRPIFSEGYFPYAGLPKLPSSPGSEPATFSAISPSRAAYVDFCPACGYGTSEVEVYTGEDRHGRSYTVRHISAARGAAFLSPTSGWVIGQTSFASKHMHWRIEHTTDGGKTWVTQYQL